MATDKLGLPKITGNMTADVVRDLNALADGVDDKAGEAGGLATLGADGKVPAEQIDVDTSNLATKTELTQGLDDKVDKVSGKQLSTEDYTTAEKTKLAGVEDGAQANTVTSVAGKTGSVSVTKSDVGLGNVDNVQQASKQEHDQLSQKVDDNEQALDDHKADDAPHQYGNRFEWRYNEEEDSLDLVVVISD